MLKFAVIAFAVLGVMYAMMMYAGSLFKQVAFTTQFTGNVSWATCIALGVGLLLVAKLSTK